MRAILKNDLIIKLSIDRGVEIGNIPNGVSLERLRWNGSAIVDLAAPQSLHVKYLGDSNFELHIVELPETQVIHMSYKQRKDLRYNWINNQIYLANEQVKIDELNAEELDLIKVSLRKYLGNREDVFMKHFALTAALIVFASQQPSVLKDFFDSIADDIKDAFPLNRWQSILMNFSKEIKNYLENYYNKLDL